MKRNFTILCLLASSTVFAAPIVKIMPYSGAHFAVGQRFDIRVEALPDEGSTITGGRVLIDGKSVIGKPENGAYVIRAFQFTAAGTHTIESYVTQSASNQTGYAKREVTVIETKGKRPRIKNIIFLLGDGMGIAHRTAARIVRFGVENGDPKGRLNMDKMPVAAMVSTSSLNSFITDSSPGMSSYQSGIHNDNNEEGVFPDSTPNRWDNARIEYISEYLHRTYGTSTGIVSTADVEDATPAAVMTHTSDRGAGTGICSQFFLQRDQTDLRVLMGGGRKWFLPEGTAGSARTDASGRNYLEIPPSLADWGVTVTGLEASVDLISKFIAEGFTYVSNSAELQDRAGSSDRLLGLFAYGNMNCSMDKIAKRRAPQVRGVVDDYFCPDQPMLPEMTEAAIKVLSKNSKGFFLMVEGASIDKQSHAMDADRAIWETIEFDYAVGKAIEFASKRNDTLVIVTADHETSGFSVIGGLRGTISQAQTLPSDHDAKGVPERQKIVGTYEDAGSPNYKILPDGFPETANIDGKVLIGFGAGSDRYEDWMTEVLPLYDNGIPGSVGTVSGYTTAAMLRAEKAKNGMFIRGQVPGSSAVHTANDVVLNAYSKNKDINAMFSGTYANVDVFIKMLKATNGGY